MRLGILSRLRHPSAEYGPAIVLEGLSLRRASHLIAISEFTRNDILKKYPTIAADDVSVIYLGATPRAALARHEDVERLKRLWGIESDEDLLLYVGRLEERKGISYLLRALAKLNRENRTKLLLIGAGNPRPYQKRASELKVSKEVVFAGRVDEGSLNASYGMATALVHPASMEGFGLVIADAVASGIPVISTRVGAIPEIVRDGIDGQLVNYGDTIALAEAIRGVLESPKDFSTHGGRSEQSRFTWEKTSRETASLYERLVMAGSS